MDHQSMEPEVMVDLTLTYNSATGAIENQGTTRFCVQILHEIILLDDTYREKPVQTRNFACCVCKSLGSYKHF